MPIDSYSATLCRAAAFSASVGHATLSMRVRSKSYGEYALNASAE